MIKCKRPSKKLNKFTTVLLVMLIVLFIFLLTIII